MMGVGVTRRTSPLDILIGNLDQRDLIFDACIDGGGRRLAQIAVGCSSDMSSNERMVRFRMSDFLKKRGGGLLSIRSCTFVSLEFVNRQLSPYLIAMQVCLGLYDG